jgi:hypothetical protein
VETATVIGSVPYADLGVNSSAATTEASEPTPSCVYWGISNTVWYKFVAPVTTTINVHVAPTTLASNHLHPFVALWAGADFTSFTQRECGASSAGDPVGFVVPVTGGTTYYFQVGGTYGSGPVTGFDFNVDRQTPANDFLTFAKAVDLPVSDLGVNSSAATTEASEPTPSCVSWGISNTVWYKFVAPVTTTINVHVAPTTLASNHLHPFVALWEGADFASFYERACGASSAGDPVGFVVPVTGSSTYYFQVGGTYGSGPVTDFDFSVVDANTPIATVPKASLSAGVTEGTSGVRLKFVWSGTGHPAVDHYNLALSTDGGPFVGKGTTASPSWNPSLASGHAYRLRVQAVDASSRISAWATSATVQPVAYQEGSARITYHGTWHALTGTAYYGGHDRYAKVPAASASFSFTGRSVRWVTTLCRSCGSARIYVNRVLVKTISLYSLTTTYRRDVWSANWSTSATRSVKIVVRGTSGHPRVDIDAFQILR